MGKRSESSACFTSRTSAACSSVPRHYCRITSLSGRAPAHRGRMPRQCEIGDLGELVGLEAQDVDIAVDEVADVEVAPIGAERDPFGESTNLDLRHLADRLSLDLEKGDERFLVPKEG